MGDSVMMLRSVLDPEMPLSERAAIEAAIAEIERLRADRDRWRELAIDFVMDDYLTWQEARRG